MKNIKPVIYEKLTTRQRIIASVEALARDDEEERLRLVSTCPKKNYHQTDWEYSEKMIRLVCMSMAHECDQRGNALNFLIVLFIKNIVADQWLQNIADNQAAWEAMLKGEGIAPETMKKVGPPTSLVLEIIGGLLPEADQENVEKIVEEIGGIYDGL